MQFIAFLLAIFLGHFMVVKAEDPKFYINNNCGFPVYVREAVGEHPGSSPGVTCPNFGESREGVLSPGGVAFGQYPVYKDSCGHSIKVARQPGGGVYQFEFVCAFENDELWYDLSHENANPFTDVEREFAGPTGCPNVKCVAGNDGSQCDYPKQKDCYTKGALNGYLCGRPGSKTTQSKPVGIWDLPKVAGRWQI